MNKWSIIGSLGLKRGCFKGSFVILEWKREVLFGAFSNLWPNPPTTHQQCREISWLLALPHFHHPGCVWHGQQWLTATVHPPAQRKHCLFLIICSSLRDLGPPPPPLWPCVQYTQFEYLVSCFLPWWELTDILHWLKSSNVKKKKRKKSWSSSALFSWVNLRPCLWVD